MSNEPPQTTPDPIPTGPPPFPAVGILTISDRAFAGTYPDRGGPAIASYLASHFSPPPLTHTALVPDELASISSAIRALSAQCCLVLTTGGTGPSSRDVTPEATRDCCTKLLPGFGERMRAMSVQTVPTAILSRQEAGVCGEAVVLNLPGSPKAIAECLDPVLVALVHAVKLVGGGRLTLKPEFHQKGKMCDECGVAH